MVETIYRDYPECDVILDYVESRFKKGLYTLTLVIGLPGTGKSSTCLRLAELTRERMNKIKRQIVRYVRWNCR